MAVEDPIRNPRQRVRVFVDFWNYTLSMRTADPAFRTDRSRLGQVLARITEDNLHPEQDFGGAQGREIW